MIPQTKNFAPRISDALTEFLEGAQMPLEVTEYSEDFAGGTTLGYVRKENQDRYVIARYCHPDVTRGFVVSAVADGVGSLPESGWSASAAIAAFVAALAAEVENSRGPRPFWRQIMQTAVETANRFVFSKSGERGASTLSALVIPFGEPACAIQVGDSKIFGVDREFRFTQLSTDQTVASQLAALGVHGGIPEDRDPRLDRSLAQYIGMPDLVVPQFVEIEPKWNTVVIASDGIAAVRTSLTEDGWNLLSKSSKSRSDLVRKILHLCNWFGGADNTTVIVTPVNLTSHSIRARDGIWLEAATCSRAIEIHIPRIEFGVPRETFSINERKRLKGTKGKRPPRDRQPQTKPELAEGKPAPTITFLPGLAKDVNDPTNP